MTRFDLHYLDEDNDKDVVKNIEKGQLIGIVDEEAGGIIAYAIGEEHANLLIEALTKLED